MNLRKTAAWGLSSLLLSGNLMMPYAAVATTLAMSGQPTITASLKHLGQTSLLMAMAREQHLLHPIKPKKQHNPLAEAAEQFLKEHQQSVKPAKSLPVSDWLKNATAALPLGPDFQINSKLKAFIAPLEDFAINGKISQATEPASLRTLAVKETPEPVKEDLQATDAKGNEEKELPEPCRLKPSPPSEANARQEALQMLAADPLDKLAALTQQMRTGHSVPRLDTSAPSSSSPDVKLKGNGAVKVLKSGVSQRVTNIELTVGKAEVIYLSSPASRVAVSNPDVASAVVISPTQIQLIGKTVGVANLLIWNSLNATDHTVVDISVHRDVSVLVNQLKYVDPGIQIVPMAAEDTVILTGEAENREAAQLAIEMAKAFFAKNATGAPGTNNGPNSQAPGSALPGLSTNVINLIKVKGEPSTKIELVRQRLQEIDPNIKIDVVPGPEGNEKVILTGRVPTASIVSKALNLASVFYGQPGMRLITAQGGNEFARMEVANAGSSQNVTTSAAGANGSGNSVVNVLQGSVLTDATGNVISMLEVAQKPQIKCSIKFLELNKTALNALGGTLSGTSGNSMLASWSGVQSAAPGKAISSLSTQDMSGSAWSTLKNAAGVSQITQGRFNEVYQNGVTQVFSLNNQLTGAIQALQEKKQVRTLAEPTLTMLSGEQGSFLAGGEIPIAFVGGQGQVSIQYKEFGIRLNLLPTVTDDGKIQMQVAPEVSSLDQTKGVATNSISVPAFVSRRMQTTLIVEPGQSFALAGLYSREDTDSISRFPGLGALPIIGAFFRNSWKDHRNSEMVVIIKPEIIMTPTGPTRQASETAVPGMLPVETKPQVSKSHTMYKEQ
jgi:Flp pilus assembly secretin CpaC